MKLRPWIDSMINRYSNDPVANVGPRDFGRWLDQYIRKSTGLFGEEKFHRFSDLHQIPVSELLGVVAGDIEPSSRLLKVLGVGKGSRRERCVIEVDTPCYYPLD